MFDPIIDRYKRFYASDSPALLARISVDPPQGYPRPMSLEDFDFLNEADCDRYVAERLEKFMRPRFAAGEGIDDDDMRTVNVLIGTGTVGAAYCDTPLHIHGNTSWCDPVIHDYDTDVDKLQFDPNNQWFTAQVNVLRATVARWDGTFSIQPFTHFDPFDLANQFRGDDIMTDFFDQPEGVRRLLSRCTELILETERYVRTQMSGYTLPGGSANAWLPGGSYLSCDLGDMVSPDVLRGFDFPFLKIILDAWGGAYFHHHELGIHQIPTVADCPGLSIQFLNRDPNTKHMPEVIDDAINETTRKLPINFICTYDELVAGIDRFKGGRYLITVRCADRDEGMRALELIRRYTV